MGVVFGFAGVLLVSEFLIGRADGEDEQERVGGSGYEGEQVWVVDAEDVVELQGAGEAEVVEEGGHYFRIVLWSVRQY